jgi:hypothetical protein
MVKVVAMNVEIKVVMGKVVEEMEIQMAALIFSLTQVPMKRLKRLMKRLNLNPLLLLHLL